MDEIFGPLDLLLEDLSNSVVSLPSTEVSLAVDSMSVVENSGEALTYTFTRKSAEEGQDVDTTDPLIVNFTVGGSATFNTDYRQQGAEEFDATGGKVTIAAGETTATVTITPIADSEIESDEAVELTLQEGTDYIIDDSEMKMAVITNDDNGPIFDAPWAKQFNDSANGYEFLAVDDAGNTYVTGNFDKTINIGDRTITYSNNNQDAKDVFVAKFDQDGNVQWAEEFGGANNENVEDITVDGSNNVYITGKVNENGNRNGNVFLNKYNKDGILQWDKNFGNNSNIGASGVEVDANGNTYLTGDFSLAVSFDPFPLDASFQQDVFVTKLNTDGNVLWAKKFGDNSARDEAKDIVVDKEGNGYLFFNQGGENAVVAKLKESDGSKVWEKALDSSDDIVAKDIAIDNTDNIYITGEFEGEVANTDLKSDDGDVYVAKLDSSNGNVVWAKDFNSGEDNDVEVEGIAVDDMSNTYVTGIYEGDSMNVGNFMLYDEGIEGEGNDNAFIAKFDSNGEVKWAQNIGGMNAETITDIAVNDGKIHIAGEFFKEATFADKTLKALDVSDTFLVKLEKEKPEISLAVDSTKVTEGENKTITYTFTRKGDMAAALTVDFTVSGSATFNDDYTLTGADEGFDGSMGKVTFKAGEATATVTLNVSDDATFEADETVVLELAMGSDYMLSTTDTTSNITITSDDKEIIVDDKPDTTGNDNNDQNKDDDKPDTTGNENNDQNKDDDKPDTTGNENNDQNKDEDKPDTSIGNDNDDDDEDEGELSFTSNGNKTFKFKSKTKGDKSSVKFSFKSKNIEEIKEIGYFEVDDDEATIDGKSPGDEGYIKAALERAKSVFSVLENAPKGFDLATVDQVLEFSSDKSFRFLSVKDGTIGGAKKGKVNLSQVAFSSEVSEENGGFDLDFAGVEINMKLDGNVNKAIGSGLQETIEVLDLREVTTNQNATFTVYREAEFDNTIGFYQVMDEDGGIDTNGDGMADILVGDAGYAQAAVENRITTINLSVDNQETKPFSGELEAGAIIVPFLIVDGTTDNFEEIFFPYIDANSDGADHIMMLGSNTFGFEDKTGGGDRDFNDLIAKVDNFTDVTT